MSRVTLMKRLTFTEQDRPDIVLSGSSIRLDPRTHSVKLKESGGAYPVGGNHYVISALTRPASVRRWTGFQADVVQPDGANTTVIYRLHDGTRHMYWNGAAWIETAADSLTHWNVEDDVAAHIGAFNAVATRQLRVVIKLRSGDGAATPELFAVRLAYEADLPSEREDLIYRTLVPALKGLRPMSDFVAKADGTALVDLGDALEAARIPFQVVGVDAAFDRTADPQQLVDLFQSYNAGTKVVTLTGAVTSGHDLVVRVIYQPVVAFDATDPDYTELDAVPSLTLVGAREVGSYQGTARDEVVDRGSLTPSAIVFPPPRRINYRIDLILSAPGGVDLQRFEDAVTAWIDTHPVMRTTGTDEPFELGWAEPFAAASGNGKGIRSARAVIELRNVYLHGRARTAADGEYPVLSLQLTGDVEVTI